MKRETPATGRSALNRYWAKLAQVLKSGDLALKQVRGYWWRMAFLLLLPVIIQGTSIADTLPGGAPVFGALMALQSYAVLNTRTSTKSSLFRILAFSFIATVAIALLMVVIHVLTTGQPIHEARTGLDQFMTIVYILLCHAIARWWVWRQAPFRLSI